MNARRSVALRLLARAGGLALGLAALGWLWHSNLSSLDPAAVWPLLPIALLSAPWCLVPVAVTTASWQRLFPNASRPPFGAAFLLSWLGLAVNWLLPVATVGGELVKHGLGRRRGWDGTTLAASLVVDKTLQVLTQIAFVLCGLTGLFALTGTLPTTTAGAAGLAAVTLGVGAFIAAQRAGLFGRLARRLTAAAAADEPGWHGTASRFDAALAGCYRRRGALAGALALKLSFRALLAGEVLIFLTLSGAALSLPHALAVALVLEAVAQGARMSAFVVPAGIGVQEGALLTTGVALGLGPETALALALVKRLRELLLGVPVLLLWQAGALTPRKT